MSNSIYNELKLAMLDKIDSINNMLATQNNTVSGMGILTAKTTSVKDNKSILDESFIKIKDAQIACIGMMLAACITRVYSNMNMLVLEAIEHRNLLIKNISIVKPHIDELCTIYGSGSLLVDVEERKNKLISIIESYKSNFKTIEKNKYSIDEKSDDNVYSIPKISDIRNEINKRCEDIISLNLYDKAAVIKSNVTTSEHSLFGVAYDDTGDNAIDPINKAYNVMSNVFKGSIEVIMKVCSDLFSVENMPVDYKMELFQEFFTAYGELSKLLEVFDSNSDISNNSAYNKYYNAIISGNSALDKTFITAYELLKKTISITDRYECAFSSDLNDEYYNKIICLFDSMFHKLDNDIAIFNADNNSTAIIFGQNDNTGENNSTENPFARPLRTDSINFAYNINDLFSVCENCPRNIDVDEERLNELKTKEIEDLVTDSSSLSEMYELTDALVKKNNANKISSRFTRISYSDPITYALLLFCVFHRTIYTEEIIDIREYSIKRLSLTGFIEETNFDTMGRRAWEFMDNYKTLPYNDTINDGIIPMILNDFSFINDIDMRPALISDPVEISFGRDTTGVSEGDKENYKLYKTILESFRKYKESKLFEINSVLDFNVLVTLIKKYPTKTDMQDIFYLLSVEYNFRSQILAMLIFLHAIDIFYSDSDPETIKMETISNILSSDFPELESVYTFITEYIEQARFYGNPAIYDSNNINSNNVLHVQDIINTAE